jgi:hypothetical protein
MRSRSPITTRSPRPASIEARWLSVLFHTYMQQIFVDGFVHADPHPGQLVRATPPGTVGPGSGMGAYLRRFWHGCPGSPRTLQRFTRNGHRSGDFGFRPPGEKLPDCWVSCCPMQIWNLIQQAQAIVFERLWGMSMGELRSIDYDQMLDIAKDFRHLIYQMPFQVPQKHDFLRAHGSHPIRHVHRFRS